MASVKSDGVSLHGRRVVVGAGYLRVDDAGVGPPLNVSAEVATSTATATQQTLKTYSLPAYTLRATHHGVYVKAYGRFAGNAQNKRATLTIGGVSITTASVTNSGDAWTLEGRYLRTAANTQRVITSGQVASTLLAIASTTDTSTDTGDIVITLKATSGSGSASDILCDALEVGFI